MKIEELKILRGPNYWSIRRTKLIQMKLDLERLLNSKVDLVSSNGLSKYIKPIIDTEKLIIYAR